MKVIGLDPGNTTGMVIIEMSGAVVRTDNYRYEYQIYNMLETFDPEEYLVAMERFTARRHASIISLVPMEIQAVVRYICGKRGFKLIEVDPGVHKPVPVHVPLEARLTPHTRDAYSVAMWAIKFGLRRE